MDSIQDMAIHASIIGVVGVIGMKIFGQDTKTALTHSAILAAGVFMYMGAFGHKLPTSLRGPFFKESN